jgi:hypothetical protein
VEMYIIRSQIHECENWERDRAVSFLGIHKSDQVCSAGIAVENSWCLYFLFLKKPLKTGKSLYFHKENNTINARNTWKSSKNLLIAL